MARAESKIVRIALLVAAGLSVASCAVYGPPPGPVGTPYGYYAPDYGPYYYPAPVLGFGYGDGWGWGHRDHWGGGGGYWGHGGRGGR
ncbi:MAG: hypothetical protein P4M00_18140 [Azospirillaceae bacterium]|nr:hypothetical protein [Azospirillaceae bacterium]